MTERDLRMEVVWSGGYGDDYFDEVHDTEHRAKFWTQLLDSYPGIQTALEVGCGKGVNLAYLKDRAEVHGIDINQKALDSVSEGIPTHLCSATDLPFEDESFDLVFTAGVLLHAPPLELPLQMAEVVRCSSRYVLALEYAGECVRFWRHHAEGVWHRNYGELYEGLGLKLLDAGEVDEDSWKGVTWWMFEK